MRSIACRMKTDDTSTISKLSAAKCLASRPLPRMATPLRARIGTREIEEMEPEGYPIRCEVL